MTARLAILIASHNRVDLTLRAIQAVEDLGRSVSGATFHVFLLDDASSDGTEHAVRSKHPEVRVTKGTGDLYWAGGMVKAFQAAREEGSFDGYVLLNDDVLIDLHAATRMVETWLHMAKSQTPPILVGAMRESVAGPPSYGGYRESSRLRLFTFEPVALVAGELVPCDTFNANFVIVPGVWFEAHGGLDRRYVHGIADFDLGLDARADGVPSFVFGEFVGICSRGRPRNESFVRRSRRERARMLFVRPFGPGPDLVFAWKHRPRVLFPLYAVRAVTARLVMLWRPRARVDE